MTRASLVIIGLIIGATALWFSLRSVSMSSIIDVLRQAHAMPILYAFVAIFGHVILKSLRWSFLLPRRQEVSWYRLLPAVAAGSFGNLVIPHSGEVLRSTIVRNSTGISGALALGSIGAERFYDFVAILVLLAAILPFTAELPFLFIQLSVLAALICAVMLMGALIIPRFFKTSESDYWSAPTNGHTSVVHRLRTALRNLFEGLAVIREHERLIPILTVSLLQWTMMAACIFYCLLAIEIPVDFTAAICILFLSIAGLTLPTAPGYFGTLQLCFTLALTPFGIDTAAAIGASILYNAIVIAFITVAGAAALFAYRKYVFDKRSRREA